MNDYELWKKGIFPDHCKKPPPAEKPYKHTMAKIYPRVDWSLLSSIHPRNEEPMDLPIKKVVFHFDTDTDQCTNWHDCIHTMAAMQKRHMLEGSDDIKFNFLIGGDGQAYEGRGFKVKPCPSLRSVYTYPRPVKGQDDFERMDIAFIGRFESYDEIPVPLQLAMYDVAEIGIRENLVDEFYAYYEARKEEPPQEIAGYNPALPPTCAMG